MEALADANAVAGMSPANEALMKLAYSILEACDLLSIGRTTLYSLIKSGDLQTRKVGRRTLILAKSLDVFIGALDGGDHDGRYRDSSRRAGHE